MMRVLQLSDDDELLFGSELTPELFKFYMQHKDAFQRMWKEQGSGFWIRFLITLRSFMRQHKKLVINPEENEILKKKIVRGCEDAYCKILDDITNSSCSAIKNLMLNIATVVENKHYLVNIAQKSVANDPFYSNMSRSAFRDLFGDPVSKDTFLMICDKMLIFLHAAGSLCMLLKRWVVAKEDVQDIINIPWSPPASWNNVALLGFFEVYLQRKFGETLFELIGVNNKYDWLKELNVAEVEFKRRIVRQMASGTSKLLPWKPLNRDWTERKVASTDVCLHLTKLVWSTYWLSLSDLTANCIWGNNVFWDNVREQCTVQVCVTMYHHLFSSSFFATLFKQINLLKTQLDDETLKELEHYELIGKKCGVSKTKWNDLIRSHQILEKIIPVFRNRTEEMINLIEDSKFCSFPDLQRDVYIMMSAWHLPLAKDYLDHALCWIGNLEELVAPLVVFPVLKELQQPLERLMLLFQQAKFLAQVCMVYVDELERLYATGDFDWLSAAEYHEMIQDLLSKLWLHDWLQQAVDNLNEIVEIAWSKQELKGGISSSPNRQRIYAKFSNLAAFPNVEALFCDNPRHFAYWIPNTPELDKQKNNFKEVRAIWKECCSKMEKGKCSNWSNKVKQWNGMNKELTIEENILFERMNWKASSLEDSIDDVIEAMTMIKDDSNIADDIFFKMLTWLKSVVLFNTSNKSSPVLDKMLENLQFLHKHGCVYMLAKSAIIASENICTTERAIFVSQLLQQCNRQIAVSSSKFSCLAQAIVMENETFVPCPSKKWYEEITAFLSDFSETVCTGNLKLVNSNLENLYKQFWDKTLLRSDKGRGGGAAVKTVADASTNGAISLNTGDLHKMNSAENQNSVLSSFGSLAIKSVINHAQEEIRKSELCNASENSKERWKDSRNTTAAKQTCEGKESTDEDVQGNSDEETWNDETNHAIFYRKWEKLVKKVVRHCYQLSAAHRLQGGPVVNKQFPHWHTLMFFMREEISYSGCFILDSSDCDDESLEETFLKKVMDRRLSWLEEEIEKWCADSSLDKVKQQQSRSLADSAGIMQQFAQALVRILYCDVIIKSSIIATLSIKENSLSDIRNATIDVLNNWSFFMLNLVANDPAFWTDMSVLMVNFTDFLEIYADYTDTYCNHIVGMTAGNVYSKCDLDAEWVPDSVEHYRVVILALLRFTLLNYYVYITAELPILVNFHYDAISQVLSIITKFFVCFSSDNIIVKMLPGEMAEVKSKLQSLWQQLKDLKPPVKKDVQILSHLPRCVVGDKSWKALMENYASGRFDVVTACLTLHVKSSTNQHHLATKSVNVNKSKKKQSLMKCESKSEVKENRTNLKASVAEIVPQGSLAQGTEPTSGPRDVLPQPGQSLGDSGNQRASSGDAIHEVEGQCDADVGNPAITVGTQAAQNLCGANTTKGKPAKQTRDHSSESRSMVSGKQVGIPNKVNNSAPETTVEDYSNQLSNCVNVPDETDVMCQSKSSVKVKAARSCAYCKSVEPSPRSYMKCALCKQHNFRPPMFYCGQECHAKHWRDGHGDEHAAFSVAK